MSNSTEKAKSIFKLALEYHRDILDSREALADLRKARHDELTRKDVANIINIAGKAARGQVVDYENELRRFRAKANTLISTAKGD